MSILRPEREAIIETLRNALYPRFIGQHEVPPCVAANKFNYQLLYESGFEDLALVGFSQANLGEPLERRPGLNVLILASPIDFPDLVNKYSILDFDGDYHHAVLLRLPNGSDEKLLCNHLVVEPLVVKSVDGLNLSVCRVNPAAAASFAILA
jgi:hypothetical protein